ncbi:protein stabilized1 [Tanacetum coccineum]
MRIRNLTSLKGIIDCRRKDRREARLNHEEIEKYWDLNTQITEQFVDLKRKLGTLSDAEWDGNPEIGDHSLRNKKKTNYRADANGINVDAIAEWRSI